MAEKVLTADDLCARLQLTPTRFGRLVQDGAIPRARRVGERTGWLWSEVKKSEFVTRPERWNEKVAQHYGPHCVYFIAVHQFVKIGYTGSLKHRLQNVQMNNPYPVNLLYALPGDEFVEEYLNAKFGRMHHRGEWFLIDQEILDFIEHHKNNPETAL